MKIVGVIPARYKSSRFPGKPLVMLAGVPMIIRVADKAAEALGKENTYIATDDERIAAVCREAGYKAIMTSENCKTGTDRVAEFANQIEADIYINIQGDEPVINPMDITLVVNAKKENPGKVINAMCNLLPDEDPTNVNLPKVLAATNGKLIYMSRLPIPGMKEQAMEKPVYKKQVCIYAFNKNELSVFSSFPGKVGSEQYEDIEILRFLEAGVDILMVEVSGNSMAVDTPEDVLKVERKLQEQLHAD